MAIFQHEKYSLPLRLIFTAQFLQTAAKLRVGQITILFFIFVNFLFLL